MGMSVKKRSGMDAGGRKDVLPPYQDPQQGSQEEKN
jgi:hypothetical protein